ncbi:MAG: L-fucose/D-arabinose isomerase [Solirubrobacteraceae bacterium]|nr:L-fucose/D-arabinose isomerase [Solirubrobacteraceae bacterium]
MRTTPIGIVMLNDERPHVVAENEADNLAELERWAEAIRAELAGPDGAAPDIVTAGETVKSVRTAQAVGEQLRRAGCRSVVMVYRVWNFPYLVWPLVNTLGRDLPILSLSNNEGAFPGNVGLLATDGALRQAGVRTHRIVGDVDDPATLAAVGDWARAAQAVTTLRNEVYGLYGGHSMGMETGFFHLVPTVKALGTNLSHIDQLWVTERMRTVDAAEVARGREWLEELLGDRLRYDGDMLTPERLETQLRLYLAVRELNDENGFDYCGIKGQRELTEHVCIADVAEMLLNDPYDWNGPKEPTVCATEADAYAAVTMQLLKYVSGGLPSLFADVRLYHPDLDIWDLCNSGQHASWFATRSNDPRANFERITFHPALSLYFKAGGASVEFDAAPGELTFARLGLWDDRPYLVISHGEAVDLPEAERRRLNEQTNPTWPHVHARLDCPVDEMVSVFPANHIHATPGDRVRALTHVAEIAGITPVVLGSSAEQRPLWERLR